MTDKPNPKGKPGEPVGYVTQDVRKRQVRPLHARRKAILAAAAALFTPKPREGEKPKIDEPSLQGKPKPKSI